MTKRVPEIRFEGFTYDWEQRKFKDFTKISQGLQIAISNRFLNEGENRLFYITNEFLNPSSSVKYYIENAPETVIANSDDILMTRTGNTGKVVTNVHGAFHNNFFKIAYDKSKTNKLFLFYLLNSNYIQNEIRIGAGSSTIPDLKHPNFYKINVNTTSLEEQTKIGNFFKSLDDTIALHQRKLEQLQSMKDGFLQKLFPIDGEKEPEIRFPGFTDDWEQRKLGEIAQFNPKSQLPDEFEYVDLESVVGTNLVLHRTENKETAPSRAQRLAKIGDVFYQTVRPYQKNNYLYDLPYDNYVFSTGYAQLRPYGNSYFLLSRVQDDRFVNNVLDRSTGTSYPAINSTDLAQIELTIPKENEEEHKIGSFFKSLDNTITLHQRELELLKQTKKAFLQKMFV